MESFEPLVFVVQLHSVIPNLHKINKTEIQMFLSRCHYEVVARYSRRNPDSVSVTLSCASGG